MALKLAVGVTRKKNNSRFSDLHANDGDMLKRIAEINQGFKPHLIVMDGMEIFVDGGPTLKRIRAAPMGRAFRILKRQSHITIKLDTRKGEAG